ncbi:PorT family protein [Flavobacterium sp. LS1R49]|uniref:PorT family protein n=1 Tax=Flavobacterium shii TaxID=2987687 RepID=A0A9X3C4J7_9FLAO|nr:PorT family protein [Flavobacterium shii]MCV9927959.1 PorT family protein [Flavobacterium shii]
MRKNIPVIIFGALLFLSPQIVCSQAMIALLFGKKITNDKLSIGLYFAEQASHLTNTDDDKASLGLAIGAYVDVKLSPKWNFCNYMTFKAPKGGTDIPLEYQVVPDANYAEGSTIKRKLVYFEIVPLFRYNITPSFGIGAGPQVGVRTVSKDFYKTTLDDGSKASVVYKTKDYFSLLDAGVSGDIQYVLRQGKGIRFNLRFTSGLTNIYRSSVPLKAFNQYWHLGVGIPIGGGGESSK